MTVSWTVPRKEMQVRGGGHTVVFLDESRRIRIDGVWVWLSAPVFMRDGDAFFPALDQQKTLDPILFPRRGTQALRTICIDPGHGGDDTGKRDGSRYEKHYTLLLAKELGRMLDRSGFRVVYTRTTDRSLELTDRAQLAQKARADLLVSLHFNGADVSSAAGTEVYCLTPVGASSTNAGGEGANSPAYPGNRWDERNIQLAFLLQKELVLTLKRDDRGLRRARFAVLRDATMPAVLIEAGFMSNPADARWIYSEAERSRLAKSILASILKYKATVAR